MKRRHIVSDVELQTRRGISSVVAKERLSLAIVRSVDGNRLSIAIGPLNTSLSTSRDCSRALRSHQTPESTPLCRCQLLQDDEREEHGWV
jgi:hypothetical protein